MWRASSMRLEYADAPVAVRWRSGGRSWRYAPIRLSSHGLRELPRAGAAPRRARG